MTVTSISAVTVSFRSVTWSEPKATAPASEPPTNPAAPAADTVELSQQAAAEARTTDAAVRAETLLKSLDTDGDGVVSKEEFTKGAMALLKQASVRFHHHRVGKGEGLDKRDDRWTARLEDIFAGVDANHDGSIDLGELTAALPQTAPRQLPREADRTAEAGAAPMTTVTFVAVAVRKYTAAGPTLPQA
jgi:Ca2+-binding EF-hand superfamily protein